MPLKCLFVVVVCYCCLFCLLLVLLMLFLSCCCCCCFYYRSRLPNSSVNLYKVESKVFSVQQWYISIWRLWRRCWLTMNIFYILFFSNSSILSAFCCFYYFFLLYSVRSTSFSHFKYWRVVYLFFLF